MSPSVPPPESTDTSTPCVMLRILRTMTRSARIRQQSSRAPWVTAVPHDISEILTAYNLCGNIAAG
ncbi:hypothetical protein SNOG_00124 [Parastagonospora nodorum SN15]|uniref:Uncharacterized protein n=1 Tax=Phaeosphaeria nodorum (strain SN15 / ATCC MYA-4574 / FGSC 10173) TaxID=321614 RepID=Q0V790_PHANO|nr:hypothetical protein SNOG_00124 [Parastagonospora nodorum SN15]EAT91619.1 hypothetical protein SNOG_00124 [Parastagonospora nodorum SN15]